MNKLCKCKTDCHCRNIYELAVLEGRAAGMSLSQYLDSVEGRDGSPGMRGASAFAVWLEQPGNEGKTIDEFWDFLRGIAGKDGQSVFNSIVFKRVEDGVVPDKPVGGNYLNPLPTDTTWSDGVPAGEGTLYMSNRTFTSDGLAPQTVEWAEPVIAADSQYVDIEWSSVEFNPGTPDTIPENWSNEAEEDSYWMALRVFKSGYWDEWNIIRVKGEKGDKGNAGDTLEIRYQKNTSFSIPPILDSTDRTPFGWELVAPVLDNGEYLWQIQAIVSQETDMLVDNWSNPVRVTGEKGVDGPSLIFRGDWKSDGEYYGGEAYVELVRYVVNGKGYIARTDAGDIPVGTVPTNTTYWNEVPLNIDAIFTDFLFAYAAYIQDLTVGSLKTAQSGTRMEITPEENNIKFYRNSETNPSIVVGQLAVEKFVSSTADPQIINTSGILATEYQLTSLGLKFLTDTDFLFAREVNERFSETLTARVRIAGKVIVDSLSPISSRQYGLVTDSIFISRGISVIRYENVTGGTPYTKTEIKEGFTGVINGAEFVNGICIGPAA